MHGLTVKEVARILGLHENTVRDLERKGKLKAVRDYRNYRIFCLDEVLKLKSKRETSKEILNLEGHQNHYRGKTTEILAPHSSALGSSSNLLDE